MRMSQPDPQNSIAPVYASPRRSLLARIAYWLACTGPFSVFIAMTFHLRHANVVPGFLEQPLWWVLRVASPFGILLGTIALIEMRSRRHLIGYNHAAAAIGFGLIATFFTALGNSLIVHSTARPHRHGNYSCQSNLKQLDIAFQMYIQDYDDRFPLAESWNEALYPYTKNDALLRCPSEEEEKTPSYAMNGKIHYFQKVSGIGPETTILLFDSRPGWNLAGGIELLPYPARHGGGNNFAYLDGHVKFKDRQQVYELLWKPASTKPGGRR